MLPNCVETTSESMHDVAFKAAVDIIQSMPKKGLVSISTSQKLRFYSLFKQGTNGRCNTPCPPMWHAVDRMKWRAWDALGSMNSLEAKKIYVIEFKNIINAMQQKYDIAELVKGSDDRMKVLLREKLNILGYDVSDSKIGEDLDDSGQQSYSMAEENYEMKKHSSNNGTNELSDQCSESSTSTGEYVDAVCCSQEPCAFCQEQLSNHRVDHMNGYHFSYSTSSSKNLKVFMQRHLKILISLLTYMRRLFATFLSNFKGYIKNRCKVAAFITILPFIAYFIMAYLC
ncbi:Acyl CoA binding family protein [Brugia pahangi]